MSSIPRWLALFAVTLSFVFGQAAPNAAEPKGQVYVIGPDDTVTIAVAKSDELSKPWRISSSGNLTLPMVRTIHVAGMTVEQFEADLRTRLKEYYVDPQVSVYISEFRSMPVTVTGGVRTPGVVQAQGARGLFDVIMRAGGTQNPGETVTVTRRLDKGRIAHPAAHDADGSSVVELPLASVQEGKGVAADLPIMAGDVVHVADVKVQRMIFIVGEVTKPGQVELITREKMSLIELIGLAGGATKTAKKSGAFIRRAPDTTGNSIITEIDLAKLEKAKVKDIDLFPGDMVVVPTSKLATIMQVVPNSAVNSGMLMLGRF